MNTEITTTEQLENIDPSNETIIDRVRYLMKISRLTQSSMARRLGVDSPYMSKVMSGRLPFSEGFINRIVVDMGVSKQWLKEGTNVPFPKPMHASTIDAEIFPKERNGSTGRGIAVYDIDVTAGSTELSRMLTVDRIMGYVDMPQINSDCLIVRVSGDSMRPTIPNGSFIAIRPVSSAGIIFWGQIYVVVTENYRMVKCLRRHTNPEYVVLHSNNPDYDDIDMPRNEIQGLYLVETIINYDRRC